MAKFNLSITAHVGNDGDIMTIFSKNYDHNVTEDYAYNPIFKMVSNLMPCILIWDEDDGNDEPGTTYCQYTNYEPGTDNYLLAAWHEIDETNGCIKI